MTPSFTFYVDLLFNHSHIDEPPNMFPTFWVFLAIVHAVVGVVELEELPQPPQPYSFSYSAGRAPGHTDRVHAETSDGVGNVRGMYSYVDPSYRIRTVEYVADKNGFHPLHVSVPLVDTKAVALEKAKHAALYEKIAQEHQLIAQQRGQDGLDDGSYKAHGSVPEFDAYQ